MRQGHSATEIQRELDLRFIEMFSPEEKSPAASEQSVADLMWREMLS